ncbi:hypothetical protein CPLU01_11511 [Colletotrichum plurivorum]|uniref:Uncharacterized protein n=1 Tax=Colletotrichum plurivorum TaxID=2175906 RepID=A0A8H6K2K2_9PEZI|nr:hypothetical protein CPLU01_11511 [Colletotrichum plurivorum]
MESNETEKGTTLANCCGRLDSHQDKIMNMGQKLAAATRQIHYLTSEIHQLNDEKEVTVSFKSGRRQ